MPLDIRTIVDKCFILAPHLTNGLGLKLAKAINKVVQREQGADEELVKLYNQVPDSMRALV